MSAISAYIALTLL